MFEPAFSDDEELQQMFLSNSPEHAQPVAPPSASPHELIQDGQAAAAPEALTGSSLGLDFLSESNEELLQNVRRRGVIAALYNIAFPETQIG